MHCRVMQNVGEGCYRRPQFNSWRPAILLILSCLPLHGYRALDVQVRQDCRISCQSRKFALTLRS
jgi:hypothetical protein